MRATQLTGESARARTGKAGGDGERRVLVPAVAGGLVPPLGPDLAVLADPEHVQVLSGAGDAADRGVGSGQDGEAGGDGERRVLVPAVAGGLVPPLGPDLAVLADPEHVQVLSGAGDAADRGVGSGQDGEAGGDGERRVLVPAVAGGLVPPLGPDLAVLADPEHVQVLSGAGDAADRGVGSGQDGEAGGDGERRVLVPAVAGGLVPPLGPDLAVLADPEHVQVLRYAGYHVGGGSLLRLGREEPRTPHPAAERRCIQGVSRSHYQVVHRNVR